MSDQPEQPPVDALTQYFLEALSTLSLAATADHHAQQAEAHLHSRLTQNPAQNQLYITPKDLEHEELDALAKQSLDAHLKQIQSAQLAQASHLRLEDLQTEVSRVFVGKRARVTVRTAKSQAITPIFIDNQTGRQTLGKKHPPIVAGRIQNVYLDKNLIILKPSLIRRWATPQLHSYAIYPLSPGTLEPDVTISV